MAGLLTGVIGSLIGTAIQATVGGIPISEDASKALDVLRIGGLPVPPANWFLPATSGEQRTQRVYDNFGQHITEAIQVLGPCMRVAKDTFGDVVHPLSRPVHGGEAWRTKTELAQPKVPCKSMKVDKPLLSSTVTVPQKRYDGKSLRVCNSTSSTSFINNACISESCKSTENFSPALIIDKSTENASSKTKKTQKLGSDSSLPSNHFKIQKTKNVHPTAIIKTETNSFLIDEKSRTKDGRKGNTAPRERGVKSNTRDRNAEFTDSRGVSRISEKGCPCVCSSTIREQSVPIFKGRKKLVKSQNRSVESVAIEKCHMCHARIRKVNKPILLPCGHNMISCHRCSTDKKPLRCSKCGLKIEMI